MIYAITLLAIGSTLAWCYVSWQVYRYTPTHPAPSGSDEVLLSVIVCARNEEGTIAACLASILSQLATEDELIVIDDHSDDGTASILADIDHSQLLHLTLPHGTSGKKAALHYGICRARHRRILQTDADCTVPPMWMSTWKSRLADDRPALAFAKVSAPAGSALVSLYQSMDMDALMRLQAVAVNRWSIPLGNAANCCFDKEIYLRYAENREQHSQRSGDDIFLAEYIVKQDHEIAFFTDNSLCVSTTAEPTWRSLLRQRLRWAEKAGAYQSKRLQLLSYGVAGHYALCVLLLLLAPFIPGLWLIALGTWIALYLSNLLHLHKDYSPAPIVLYTLVHPALTLITGIASLLGVSATWKGRKS